MPQSIMYIVMVFMESRKNGIPCLELPLSVSASGKNVFCRDFSKTPSASGSISILEDVRKTLPKVWI